MLLGERRYEATKASRMMTNAVSPALRANDGRGEGMEEEEEGERTRCEGR